ncbi:hypothetical protein AB2H94_25725 (plasmid) [Escherichia coli]
MDRNIITRCINTAGLPRYISYLQSSGELSARAGILCLRFTKKHGCIAMLLIIFWQLKTARI